PADKAGLTTGDFLETIKGVATRDMPLAYAQLLLRGEPGSTIDLSVLRRKPEPQKLTMTRAIVAWPNVESKMLADNIGYIKVPVLANGRVKEVSTAALALQKQGAKRLVLDLRNCATGDPDEGVDLANLFIGNGVITWVEGQKVPKKTYMADEKKMVSSLPLVVLTNHGTAAAAEIAAAALQGDKRGTVVGERTYGDAAIHRAITMEDGSAVILSVAKYYSPAGKAIQDTSVTPDELVVEPEPSIGDAEDDNAPEPAAVTKKSDDMILKKAIEIVQTK
ncbi:MAG: S41 family peptidase, partial [Terriglobia bacterium]